MLLAEDSSDLRNTWLLLNEDVLTEENRLVMIFPVSVSNLVSLSKNPMAGSDLKILKMEDFSESNMNFPHFWGFGLRNHRGKVNET